MNAIINYTILFTPLGETFPQAWTTCAPDKEAALRAFRINKPGYVVWKIVRLPARPPLQCLLP